MIKKIIAKSDENLFVEEENKDTENTETTNVDHLNSLGTNLVEEVTLEPTVETNEESDDDLDDNMDFFGVMEETEDVSSILNQNPSSKDSLKLPSLVKNDMVSGLRTKNSKDESSKSTEDSTKEEAEEEEDIALYEWCEGFRYQPSVEYIRLKRLHPKQWEGIQITGWIMDLYEAIDEQYLAENWGGGIYKLEAYQLDRGGRTRIKGSKIVEISGIPTHFTDENGNPHKLPQNNKYRSNDMLIGRNRGINKFNRSSDRTSSPSSSAVELLKLTQQNNKEQRDDTKTLEILRMAQNDVQSQMSQTAQMQQNMYKELIESQRKELERMRLEQEKVISSAQRPLEEALSTVKSQAEKESTSLKDQMLRIEAEYRDRLNSVKDELNKQQQMFLREKEDLKDSHRTQMELVLKEHREQVTRIKETAESSTSTNFQQIRLQMDSLRDNHQNQITNMQNDHQKKLSDLYREMSVLRDDSRNREQTLRTDYNERENKLTKDHYKALNDARTDYLDRLQAIKDDFEKREKDRKEENEKSETKLRESIENKYESKISSLEERLEYLKSNSDDREKSFLRNYEKREKDVRDFLDASYKSQVSVVTSERDRLKEEVASLKEEMKSLKEGVNKQSDPIAKLAEIQSFKENLKTFGFLPNEEETQISIREPEEKTPDPPKDFLGKIAHYGPSIAQNFLGPVLARVDGATNIANQALDAQREELKNQSMALNLQQQQMEHEYRERAMVLEEANRQAVQTNRQAMLSNRVAENRRILEMRRMERERESQANNSVENLENNNIKRIRRRRSEVGTELNTDIENAQVVNTQAVNIEAQELEMPQNTGDDGYTQLADFLEKSMNEKTSSGEVVNKLKTASFLGMIPKGLLEETVADSFENLYENVKQVALRKNYNKINSPRGIAFCQEVYNGLKK